MTMKPIVLMVDKYSIPFAIRNQGDLNTNTMNVPRVDKLSQPTDRSMNVAKPPSMAVKQFPEKLPSHNQAKQAYVSKCSRRFLSKVDLKEKRCNSARSIIIMNRQSNQ